MVVLFSSFLHLHGWSELFGVGINASKAHILFYSKRATAFLGIDECMV